MKTHKVFAAIILALIITSCGNKSEAEKNPFSLQIKNAKKTYKPSDELSVSITNKESLAIDSVVYSLRNKKVAISVKNNPQIIPLQNQKLGKDELKATIYVDGERYEANTEFTLLASKKPELYTYKVLETYPHDVNAFTQGLEFEGDTLYESTGKRGESTLRKTNYKTGEVLQQVKLDNQYFGEGLTILNNKIYQLTWQANKGFIYDETTLERTGSFVYENSKEGWGLCHSDSKIYKSDGTERIWMLNPETLAETDYIELYTHTSRIPKVNELEWVEGKIYANVWEQSSIAIVNPDNGAVEGVIDLNGLQEKVTQHTDLNVLNGIAYKGEKDILYITGKYWDKLFKVQILKK
tara:strand:+ start:90 stop:1145 length:1056 start_codon:yes stop_codon:yes gene_type:complete